MQTAASTREHQILIVSDDLTGACDAAVAFAARGLATRVVLDGPGEPETETMVTAISTGSRDLSADAAVERLHEVAQRYKRTSFCRIFKKIDSVFRGNTTEEICAAVRIFAPELCIIAPAYPALGRTSVDGVLHVRDLAGEKKIAALDELRSKGLHPHPIKPGKSVAKIAAELQKAIAAEERSVYCDAVVQSDLDLVVRAADTLGKQILWVGSAGLAHALAAEIPATPQQQADAPRGLVLLFIGTAHPVTALQLAALRTRCEIAEWPRSDSNCAIVFLVAPGTTEEALRKATQSIDPQTVSCLVMTGGETAALVCSALHIRSIDLQMEFEPGLPHGQARGGALDGCDVVLKSGGFGEADVLCRIVERFGSKRGIA